MVPAVEKIKKLLNLAMIGELIGIAKQFDRLDAIAQLETPFTNHFS